MSEFRHGNRNARNVYQGADHHVAVVVARDDEMWADFVIDALNAYWALGNRPDDPAIR